MAHRDYEESAGKTPLEGQLAFLRNQCGTAFGRQQQRSSTCRGCRGGRASKTDRSCSGLFFFFFFFFFFGALLGKRPYEGPIVALGDRWINPQSIRPDYPKNPARNKQSMSESG